MTITLLDMIRADGRCPLRADQAAAVMHSLPQGDPQRARLLSALLRTTIHEDPLPLAHERRAFLARPLQEPLP